MHLRVLAKHTALAVLLSFATSPVLAANSANSMSVKVGYFNLALVKASFPESAGSDVLKTQAENQLRRDVELGNSRLQKSQEEKKPKEEIEKMAQQLQVEINAKQHALIELVQNQTQAANQQIAAAVAQVAKDKGLDVVVDGAGVYSGGDKIVSSGEDITESVVKKLSPLAAKSSSAPSAAPAPSGSAAASKK